MSDYVNGPFCALPPRIFSLLESLGRHAVNSGMRAWCVGGVVRDLVLGRRNMDVDVVVEGDGIRFAESYGREHHASVYSYKRFGTAHLAFSDDLAVDIATARTEIYEKPGALPTVKAGTLDEDLGRRDFTINALAASLDPARFGVICDYFNGRSDLRNRVIRVLHARSFIDDPTRIFRAVRFEKRFDFQIEPVTESLIREALSSNCLDTVSTHRIVSELKRVLCENDARSVLIRLDELEILSFAGRKANESIKKILYEIDQLMESG